MKKPKSSSRRALVKSSVFGLLGVSIPNIGFAREIQSVQTDAAIQGVSKKEGLFYRYPSIDDEIVQEVVGKSHFNLDRVKELVDGRPELARATWDWGFGDWETAIGAASHVGRRDIANYLMSKGARPDLFTYAVFGAYEAVKAMLEATPGVQSMQGPHGITLLSHAKAGLRMDELTEAQKDQSKKLIEYLEELGDADVRENNLKMTATEMEKYVGDYKYGEGEKNGFSVKVNMRKMLSLGRLGKFGGGLFQRSENVFIYNGTSSVQISFQFDGDKVKSLTVTEPELVLVAEKV